MCPRRKQIDGGNIFTVTVDKADGITTGIRKLTYTGKVCRGSSSTDLNSFERKSCYFPELFSLLNDLSLATSFSRLQQLEPSPGSWQCLGPQGISDFQGQNVGQLWKTPPGLGLLS